MGGTARSVRSVVFRDMVEPLWASGLYIKWGDATFENGRREALKKNPWDCRILLGKARKTEFWRFSKPRLFSRAFCLFGRIVLPAFPCFAAVFEYVCGKSAGCGSTVECSSDVTFPPAGSRRLRIRLCGDAFHCFFLCGLKRKSLHISICKDFTLFAASFSRPWGWKMGLEPTTFGTTIRRSNQLSYIHRIEFASFQTACKFNKLFV